LAGLRSDAFRGPPEPQNGRNLHPFMSRAYVRNYAVWLTHSQWRVGNVTPKLCCGLGSAALEEDLLRTPPNGMAGRKARRALGGERVSALEAEFHGRYELSVVTPNIEDVMQFMVIEKFRNQDAKSVYRRLREKGRLMPDGLAFVSSWVEADLRRCFQVVESSDVTLLQQWVAEWSDLIDFEIVAVVPGKGTAEVFASAFSNS